MLWSFPNNEGEGPGGYYPDSTPASDGNGVLYGTTDRGGKAGYGEVYSLTPPVAGGSHWHKTTIYATLTHGRSFSCCPSALTLTADGSLYGLTRGRASGSVVRLAPPAAGMMAWTEQVLYTVRGETNGPYFNPGLVVDASGAFYGTTNPGRGPRLGTVFKLTPPAVGTTTWTKTTLYSFPRAVYGDGGPSSGVIADAAGALYGTTGYGGKHPKGTVYRLSPPAPGSTQWTLATLHTFDGKDGSYPSGGLVTDAGGELYGRRFLEA